MPQSDSDAQYWLGTTLGYPTADLRLFVFAYAKSRFSHDEARRETTFRKRAVRSVYHTYYA